MTELRPIPFIGSTRYRIEREGQVFSIRPTRPGRPPRVIPITPLTRIEAEDASKRVGNGRRRPGEHFSLVSPPWVPPAGAEPMVWCRVHRPDDESQWAGTFIHATGDTDRLWFLLDLGPGTAIIHGPSIAAEVFKSPTGYG